MREPFRIPHASEAIHLLGLGSTKNAFSLFFVLPEGFEPPITASKAVVISISLRERRYII